MRRQYSIVSSLVSLLFLVGCATTQEHEIFVPLERAQGQTLEGYTEALYDISGPGGRFGEVKVWSRGAYTSPEADKPLIHVGFDVDNRSEEALELAPEQIRLESVQTGEQVLRDIKALSPPSIATIAPDSTGRIELVFALPAHVRPSQVQAFRVAWAVESDGYAFKEFTPFARTAKAEIYVPVHAYFYPYHSHYYPHYDPFWHPRRRVVIVRRHYPRRVIVRGHRRPGAKHRSPARRRK
jgi:hypothetical protein